MITQQSLKPRGVTIMGMRLRHAVPHCNYRSIGYWVGHRRSRVLDQIGLPIYPDQPATVDSPNRRNLFSWRPVYWQENSSIYVLQPLAQDPYWIALSSYSSCKWARHRSNSQQIHENRHCDKSGAFTPKWREGCHANSCRPSAWVIHLILLGNISSH